MITTTTIIEAYGLTPEDIDLANCKLDCPSLMGFFVWPDGYELACKRLDAALDQLRDLRCTAAIAADYYDCSDDDLPF